MTRLLFDLVVWDFDGVLNRNLPQETYAWVSSLASDRGFDPVSFEEAVFGSGRFAEIMCGQRDLLEVVTEWLGREGAEEEPDVFLRGWFEHEATPDPEVGQWLDACRHRKVIGTNNEPRRSDYIGRDMGFGARVERIFSSGQIGAVKPDPAFYRAIEEWAGLDGGRILLIDDSSKYIAGAHSRGWNAFHFTAATRHRLPDILGIN
ncbi:MAG TPA: hypothetical protein PK450_13410 [Paracoccaceae bacterium]|nr:hypothetical protein [Paracoccaceae bacterium]